MSCQWCFAFLILLENTKDASIAVAYDMWQATVAENQGAFRTLQGQVNDVVLQAYSHYERDQKWINSELSGTSGIDDVADEQSGESENERSRGPASRCKHLPSCQ